MQLELGKCHSGGVFTKFRLAVSGKGGDYLEVELFYMWSCTLAGLDCVRPHVYLSLAWALLFQLNVALLLELLNESIAQKYSRPVWASTRERMVTILYLHKFFISILQLHCTSVQSPWWRIQEKMKHWLCHSLFCYGLGWVTRFYTIAFFWLFYFLFICPDLICKCIFFPGLFKVFVK